MAAGALDIDAVVRATHRMEGQDAASPGAILLSPCVSVRSEGATFRLHPPTAFAVEEDDALYKLMLPFGRAAVDLSLGEGRCVRRHLRPGDLVLAQPGSRLAMRHVDPLEFLLVTLAPDGVRQVAAAAAGDAWRLADAAPWHDAAVVTLGQEMRRVMIAEALPQAGYLDALAGALIARVAVAGAGEAGRASRELMAPAALARVVRHIEAHLTAPIEVAELARVAELSPAHFARVFARATGDTPHRFVMKRRVCRARDMLAGDGATLAEIAARAGFASQAHMSTAFSREVGLSPARYRAAFRPRDAENVRGPSERERMAR